MDSEEHQGDDQEQLRHEEEEEEEEEEGHDEEHNIKNDNFHVLAVDDSLIDRKILEKLLTLSSYHVTCVESGDKALEYLGLVDHGTPSIYHHHHHHHHHHPNIQPSFPPSDQYEGQGSTVNLIMTDYSMPGITGFDLLKKVKQSSWKDIPVVVMSSENVPSRIHMCLEGGADEFLLKPVRLSDLKKLHPHLLKSTAARCLGKNTRTSKELLGESSSTHDSGPNYGYNNQGIPITDLSSCSDNTGKAQIDDDHHFDKRAKFEGLINCNLNV